MYFKIALVKVLWTVSANIIVKWLFSHERLTKTAPKCNPTPNHPNPCFQIKKTPGEHSLQIKWVVIKWVCSQVWFRSIMSVKVSCGWLIRLNLLKLKLVEHILNFSRFHCDDGLIHWLTSSRFIVYWCFFVICSPSFERERESPQLTQSCITFCFGPSCLTKRWKHLLLT